MIGGRTAAALWSAATRTCSILLAVFLCSCHQAFSPSTKPNPVYSYILDIYIICKHKSTKLNSSKYCYVSLKKIQTVLFLTTQFSISQI